MTAALAANSAIPAGLKRAHDALPDGVTKHAAGILFVAPDGDVLLLRRSAKEANYSGHWALPGGGVEDGETPELGAAREAKEETGVDVDPKSFKLLDRSMTPTGTAFHTFAAPSKKFVPSLNTEHSGYAWSGLDMLPRPLHPAVEQTLKNRIGVPGADSEFAWAPDEFKSARDGFVKWTSEEEAELEHEAATDSALRLALDRDPSVREFDRDGRLHVAVANICKANICPYRGNEIPQWESLGLDADRIYQLYRDPAEIEKAATTANGVQLLRKHTPVNAEDHKPYDVIGTTGTDSIFEDPFLKNSLVVWAKEGIEDIESEEKREISPGYHYRADMTPGNFGGKAFDGVMRDIAFNHVAIVSAGRQGSDVIVGDSMENLMSKKPTRIAALATGLTARAINPLLAMDKKVDLMPIFGGVTSQNFDSKKLTASLKAALKGNTIAQDVDIEHVAKMLDHVGEAAKSEPKTSDESVSEPQHKAMMAAAEGKSNLGIPKSVGEEFQDADTGKGFDGIAAWAKSKGLGEDDVEELRGLMPKPATDEDPEEKKKKDEEARAEDEEEDEEEKKKEAKDKAAKDKAAKDAEMKDMVTKPAMDAALKAATEATAKTIRETERGIRVALSEVRPYVGELPATLAFDSATDVYRHTATMLGIDGAKTLHPDALWPVIRAQKTPKDRQREHLDDRASMGMDAAAIDEATKIAPGIAHITVGA
jgi:hypothetical protein